MTMKLFGFLSLILIIFSASSFAFELEGDGVCLCYSCEDCRNALDDTDCYDLVKLENDLSLSELNENETKGCFRGTGNFSGKIFDCQGHKLFGKKFSKTNYGIELRGVQDFKIKNCFIQHVFDGISVRQSSDITFEGCGFSFVDYGIIAFETKGMVIRNSIFFGEKSGNEGLSLRNSCSNFLIDNCSIQDYNTGINLDKTSNAIIKNSNIKSNHIGLSAGDSEKISINNNTFYENYFGGISIANSSLTIQSNIFCKNEENGDDFYYVGSEENPWGRSTGENNTCDKPGDWTDKGIFKGCSHSCRYPFPMYIKWILEWFLLAVIVIGLIIFLVKRRNKSKN